MSSSPPENKMPRSPAMDGFTLIEVIAAMAIVAISLTMVMQLFSGGLRNSRASCDYTRAVVHAKDKMEEITVSPGQESGVFEDGFKWESYIEPQEELEEISYKLLKIKIKVLWGDRADNQKYVELETLRLVSDEEDDIL